MIDQDTKDCLFRIEAYLKRMCDMMVDRQVQPKQEAKAPKDHVEKIYAAYPSRCVVSNRSSGKCSKNKDKIKKILKDMSYLNFIAIIKLYTEDCRESDTYMKNFSTFLNNLPDINEFNKKPSQQEVKETKFQIF